MRSNYIRIISIFSGLFLFGSSGCKKLTQVSEPVNTITTTEAFNSDATATSAIMGIYNDMLTGGDYGFSYANGATTVNAGMSADELHVFGGSSQFETNTLTASGNRSALFWAAPYFDIYLTNAAIETLPLSTGVSAAAKKQLVGEAKFFRAFSHFYLVNLFGDIPYLTTTAYAINDTIHRQSVSKVYAQIIADLLDAQSLLSSDYSVSKGEKTRVNKFGATAMLARAYLYVSDWKNAELQASSIIENTDYMLEVDLKNVFLANSKEAILQLQTADTYPYATTEGNTLIPLDNTSNPSYYLTDSLLNAFEVGDKRRSDWVDSTTFSGDVYYYPSKYKVYTGTAGNVTEYYMVLRLAEQYLIRAEARAHNNNLDGALSDLNTIRGRARLTPLPTGLTQDQILAAVAQERRIELFAEWGHRWLDLKRTGQANTILSFKPKWKTTAQLYPIPASELISDANLTQNPGY